MAGPRKIMPAEERREQLLEAAALVFSEKGYRNASVSDVVERANVARGTFYNHFSSKQDVFLELIERYFDEFAGILRDSHDRLKKALDDRTDPLQAWRDSALAVLSYHSKHPALTAVVYREAMGLDENFSKRVEELQGFARKTMADEFRMLSDRGMIIPADPDLVSTMVNGAVVNIIMEYIILPRKPVDLELLAGEVVRFHARALASSRAVVEASLAPPTRR